jgi:hypothetical protein
MGARLASALNQKRFFYGVRKLVDRWTKCRPIEKQGDHAKM